MPALIEYLLKVSLSIFIVYLFYQLWLRKLTFYNWNRWYLLGYTILSFFIPFINITPVLERNELTDNKMLLLIPSVQSYTGSAEQPAIYPAPVIFANWSKWEWMMLVIGIGMLLFLLKFLISYISFRIIRRRATLISGEEGTRIYQVDKNIIPFSFGNDIFINQLLHTKEELAEIIQHEFVHIKQKHSIDILWAELLCMLNWYNPFAWFIRKTIRQNLEFIADDKVVQGGIDKKQYQYLLLKVIGNNHFSIAQKFNFSSLKKRIAMMNKIKTARIHLFKFMFLLPLLAVLLLAFRDKQKATGTEAGGLNEGNIFAAEQLSDTLPYKKAAGEVSLHRGDGMGEEHHKFFKKNQKILLLHWTNNGAELEIYLEGDKTEKYNLNDKNDLQQAEMKYGKLPAARQGSASGEWNPKPTAEEKDFIRRHPDVDKISWAYMISASNSVDQPGQKTGDVYGKPGDMFMTITFKNGKWDMYNVNRSGDIEKFKKAYGELPPAAPAKPANPSHSDHYSTATYNEKGYLLRMADNNGNCMVVVKDRSGTEIEKLLLTKWNENKETYEDRYGVIPPASTVPEHNSITNHSADVELLKSTHSEQGNNKHSSAPADETIGTTRDESDSVLKAKYRNLTFIADTIFYASEKGVLRLKGRATVQDMNADVILTADEIELHQNLPLIYINGKEAELHKDYVGKKGGKYNVKSLNKQEAIKKYGDRGKEGAVEITSQ